MFTSQLHTGGSVSFPSFMGERVYMEKFHKEEGLPKHLRRWQDTVDQMLVNVDTDNPIYIMIDQAKVAPKKTHRREGVHIDGYWIDREYYAGYLGDGAGGGRSHRILNAHGSVNIPSGHGSVSNGWGSVNTPSGHGSLTSINRNRHVNTEDPYIRNQHGTVIKRNPNCPKIPRKNTHGMIIGWDDPRPEIPEFDSHGNLRRWIKNPKPPKYDSHGNFLGFSSETQEIIITDDWSTAELQIPEAIILASNYSACKGYVGEWEGTIKDGGDCSEVDLSNLKEVLLEPNKVYIGNVGFLHETLPVEHEVERTLVRLNVKDWELPC